MGEGLLAARLTDSPIRSLTLQFGKAESFHEHGILLPCTSGEHAFRLLREHILGSRSIKRQSPHITLAHPRNPKVAGNALAVALLLPQEISVTFTSVNLIEQSGASAWRIVETFRFSGEAASPAAQP